MLKKIKNFIQSHDELGYKTKLYYVLLHKHLGFISDRSFIKRQYFLKTKNKLDLDNPQTYNEKLQWMKLYYRNPILPKLVDKYTVRDFVKNKIGGQYLIPLIGVYDNVDEIDFNKLPDEFIVKLNNGSSFNYICTNKTDKEIDKIKQRFRKWINVDYYMYGREWAYKNVENKIIIEELLKPSSGEPPKDFRFFCFGGEVKFISVDSDSVVNNVKTSDYYRNLYNKHWELIDARIKYPNNPKLDEKPERLDEMIHLAKRLSEEFPAVRVDFYYFDNKIYFGELTFYHGSGYQKIYPPEFSYTMGNWMNLNKKDI